MCFTIMNLFQTYRSYEINFYQKFTCVCYIEYLPDVQL